MPLTVAERNDIATAQATDLPFVSLHTADPGTTGASEATGGSPAYARKALTWGAASNGTVTAAEVTFDVPAGTYTHFGLFGAATGTAFKGGNPLAVSQTVSSQGQIKLTVSMPVTAS